MDTHEARTSLAAMGAAYTDASPMIKPHLKPMIVPMLKLLSMLIEAEEQRQQREEKNAN